MFTPRNKPQDSQVNDPANGADPDPESEALFDRLASLTGEQPLLPASEPLSVTFREALDLLSERVELLHKATLFVKRAADPGLKKGEYAKLAEDGLASQTLELINARRSLTEYFKLCLEAAQALKSIETKIVFNNEINSED